MVLEAARAAAVRQQSAARRAHELQERIERLRSGHLATSQDVVRAQESVEAQRVACAQADRRLAAARAAVAEHSRHEGSAIALSPAGADSLRYERLRNAFVSLCLEAAPEDSLVQYWRRRRLAEAVADRATARPRVGWPAAVCAVASRLPGVRAVAMSTFGGSGVPHSIGASDDWSRQVEEMQQVLGEGPGVTAHLTRRPVVVVRLAAENRRWPGYVAAVVELGVGALCALPIPLGPTSLGSITFYRGQDAPVRDLGADACTMAMLAAAAITVDLEEPEHDTVDLDDTYRMVDVAAGMLSAQLDVPIEQAMARIRAYAFGTGALLSAVAQAIVQRRLRLP